MAAVAAAELQKTLNYDSIISLRILPKLEAVLVSPTVSSLKKNVIICFSHNMLC